MVIFQAKALFVLTLLLWYWFLCAIGSACVLFLMRCMVHTSLVDKVSIHAEFNGVLLQNVKKSSVALCGWIDLSVCLLTLHSFVGNVHRDVTIQCKNVSSPRAGWSGVRVPTGAGNLSHRRVHWVPGGKAAVPWSWPPHLVPRSMRGSIPPLPNTPSWRGAQLKNSTGITLPTYTLYQIVLGCSDAL
jgi:hypothetical protein